MALYQIWKLDTDPTDFANPYTPYTFVDRMQTRDMGLSRREAITTIPGAGDVISAFGRRGGPFAKRDFTVGFRVLTNKGPYAAHDLLMAAILGKNDVRLVDKTDVGTLRFTTASFVSCSEPRTNNDNWYFDFKVTWRIRSDWRLRYSEISEVWQSAPENFDAANDEVFGSLGTTLITSTSQAITIDATGIAGDNLPTIDDTGPKIYIVGPAGGDGGIIVSSYTATEKDANGTPQSVYFSFPYKLLTSHDAIFADLSWGAFWVTLNGVTTAFRPFKPAYQSDYFRIVAGVINNCLIATYGANPLTGGSITIDWSRKFG